MKKKFTFSIDTSKPYFWVWLAMSIYILFLTFGSSDSKENSKLKSENEILLSNERKYDQSIIVLKDSINRLKTNNTALQSKLSNQKTEYKTITIEKDAKKNTIDSYDYASVLDAFAKRYHQDRTSN